MSRRGRDVIKSESIPPPGWSPTNRWTKTATDALPKEQGVRAPPESAQSGCTALERQLLEKQWVLSWRDQRTQRIRDSALKVLNLILSESRHKGNHHLKGPWITHLLVLESLLRMETPGDRDAAISVIWGIIWGACSTESTSALATRFLDSWY